MKNNFTTVVIHPTAYDGSLESAALQSGHWTVGTSTTDIHYKAARDSVKNHLLQEGFDEPIMCPKLHKQYVFTTVFMVRCFIT